MRALARARRRDRGGRLAGDTDLRELARGGGRHRAQAALAGLAVAAAAWLLLGGYPNPATSPAVSSLAAAGRIAAWAGFGAVAALAAGGSVRRRMLRPGEAGTARRAA